MTATVVMTSAALIKKKGASRGLEGGLKPSTLKGASGGLEGGFKGA